MKHQEVKRIVPGAGNALLCLHGIVGSPNHFIEGVPVLKWTPEDWSVHILLLPGHGLQVRDFARSSMKQWRAAVWDAFDALARTHERVYIAAHSMGTLFALELAAAHPEKIPGLYLLGVPLRPHVAPSAVNSALRLALGKLRPGYPEMGIRMACGTAPTWKLWEYIPWLPRFLELFGQIRRTEKRLGEVRTPAIVFQSRKDELVSGLSGKALARYLPKITVLEHSTHFYYAPEDLEILKKAFAAFLAN